MSPRISGIVALGKNRVMGKDNDLLWRISDDLKRFKRLTMGHPVIMGRKTFDSIGRPLPERVNIVITRGASFTHEGISVAHSLQEALGIAQKSEKEEIFIIGGGQIFSEALPLIERLYLTKIESNDMGDIFFPAYEKEFVKEIFREERRDGKTGLRYTWIDVER